MRLLSEIVARSSAAQPAEPVDPYGLAPEAPEVAAAPALEAPLPRAPLPEPPLVLSDPVPPADLPEPDPAAPAIAPEFGALAEQPIPNHSKDPALSRRAMAQEAMKMLQERAVPAPQAGASAPEGRAKTRLLGFGAAEAMAEDVFDSPGQSPTSGGGAKFPVGWLVVTDGPGAGASFSLHAGAAQIGRGEDQAISLDFGDTAISRANHAAVAYDSEMNAFYLGHGGKSNIVRLNNKPVLSTEEMRSGDEIRIGETTLRFVAFCGDGFTWAAAPSEG